MSRILSVEEILAAPDIEERIVECPEWGGSVRVRSFTKLQINRMSEQASVEKRNRQTGQMVKEVDSDRLNDLMFREGVVDPTFSDEQMIQLRAKNAAPILRITKAILELSGLGSDSAAQAESAFPAGRREEVPVPASA